ncbi:surface-adhesin E family protein [Caballeronia sp. ATUFL_M1_KS5A]|uniref:surface-adhesin E family protein n=1 Tax=Caballeronia sp. ATUFL_M1_KS5A TaxID=2921778 RepID=UPI0020297608|nr:surface-adhesin E family protein [Caballeronia sp. ATUFL_M1_KS5A]
MKKIFVATVCAVMAASAFATDWQRYASSENFTVFVATDRVKKQNGIVTVWSKWVYVKPRSTADGRPYEYTISQDLVNCAAGSSRTMSSTAYNGNGESVKSSTNPSNWEAAVPDSVMETVIGKVCSI